MPSEPKVFPELDKFNETLKKVFTNNADYYLKVIRYADLGPILPREEKDFQQNVKRFNFVIGDGNNFHDIIQRYGKDANDNHNEELFVIREGTEFSGSENTNLFRGEKKGFLLRLFTDIQLQKIYDKEQGNAFNHIIKKHATTIRERIAGSIIGGVDDVEEYWRENPEKEELNSEVILQRLKDAHVFDPASPLDVVHAGLASVLRIDVALGDLEWLYIENQFEYLTKSADIDPILRGLIQGQLSNPEIENNVGGVLKNLSPEQIQGAIERIYRAATREQIEAALGAFGFEANPDEIGEVLAKMQLNLFIQSLPEDLQGTVDAQKDAIFKKIRGVDEATVQGYFRTLTDPNTTKKAIEASLGQLGILPAEAAPAAAELFAELQYQRILDTPASRPGLLNELWETPDLVTNIKKALQAFSNPEDIDETIKIIKNAENKQYLIDPLDELGLPNRVDQFFGRKQLELARSRPLPEDHPVLKAQFTDAASNAARPMEAALGQLADTNAVKAAFANLYNAENDLTQTRAAMEKVGLPLGGVGGADEKLKKLYAENKFQKLLEAIKADGHSENYTPPLPERASDLQVKNWLKVLVTKPGYADTPLNDIDADSIDPANIPALKTAIIAQQTHHAAANIDPLLTTHMFPEAEDLPKFKAFISTFYPAIKNNLMGNDQAQLKALLAAKNFREFIGILNTCGLEHSEANTGALKDVYAELHAYNRNANLQNASLARALASQGVYLKKDDIDEWNKNFTTIRDRNGGRETVVDSLKQMDMYRWDVEKMKGVKLSPEEKAALLDVAAGNDMIENAKLEIINERKHTNNKPLYRRLNGALQRTPQPVGEVAVLHTLIRMKKQGEIELNVNDINNILSALEQASNYAVFCSAPADRPGIQALDKSCPNWKTILTEEKFMALKQRLEVQRVLNLNNYNEHRMLIEADQRALKKQEQDLGGETRAWYRTHGKGEFDSLAIDKNTLRKLGALRDVPWLDPQFQASSKQYAHLIKPRVQELKELCAIMLPAYKNDRNDVQKRLDRLPTVEEAEACNTPEEAEACNTPAQMKYTPAQLKTLDEHRKHLKKRLDFLDGEIKKYQKADYVINGDPAVADKDSFKGMGLLKCIERAEKGQFIKVVGTSWRCESVTPEQMEAELSAIKAGGPLPVTTAAALASYNPDHYKAKEDAMVGVAHDVDSPTSRPRITPKYVDVPGIPSGGPYRITVGKENPHDPNDVGFFYLEEKKDGSATTIRAGQFPKTGPERVRYSMLQAKFLLENTPLGKTPKLEIFGGSREEREFLWTALMLLSDTKGMKFGRKDIDLMGDKDFSNKWGNIDKDGAVYQVFKENWGTVEENRVAMQELADKREQALKAFAGYEVDEKEKLVGPVKRDDLTKVLSPMPMKNQLASERQAYLDEKKDLKTKTAKEEKEERLNPKPRPTAP